MTIRKKLLRVSSTDETAIKIGVISDTHGYFHPHLPAVFGGVSLILHAGDVGNLEVIRRLETIAPVLAVRGNADRDLNATRFPLRRLVQVEQVTILVTHIGDWTDELAAWLHQEHRLNRPDVLVCGHTHRASHYHQQGLLHFNPGAAGRSRVVLGPTVGILTVRGDQVIGQILQLAG
ncbi:MAG: metallophosphoesterase family protein [Chloroflexota bacterium]